MANGDCQTRLKKELKESLDELEFAKKKSTYSDIIQTLLSFYQDNKEQFKKWQKKQNKK